MFDVIDLRIATEVFREPERSLRTRLVRTLRSGAHAVAATWPAWDTAPRMSREWLQQHEVARGKQAPSI